MPPKATNGNGDDKTADITALCHLMMSCDDFKADNNKVAPILNIAQGKNVPRKINSIIGPCGFELKGGKIVVKDDEDGASVPATPKATTSADDNGTVKTPKTPASKKKSTPKKATSAARKTPNSKKRKLDNAKEEEDADANDRNVKAENDAEDDQVADADIAESVEAKDEDELA